MNKNIFSAVITLLPLLLSSHLNATSVSDAEITPIVPAFSAQYAIYRGTSHIGTAERTLVYKSDELAEYSYSTNLKWFIFSDRRSETSNVKIIDSQLTPLGYRYTREGTGSDKAYEWTYDVENNTAVDILKDKTKSIDFPDNIQDKLSYHLQNRLNLIANPNIKKFIYPVISTSGSIKDYEYEFDTEEELMLPYGLVKTVRFKREVKEKSKITYAWFAPEHKYLLVKLRLEKDGGEQFRAELDNYSLQALTQEDE